MSRNAILEALAVIFNLLFTFLYINGSAWCFLFGILGPLLLGWVCWQKKLYAETFLQIIYICSAILGLYTIGNNWEPRTIEPILHIFIIIAGIIATLLSGYLLVKKTDAKLPYIDSFTTTFGIIATFLMMYLIPEAFLYLMVINFVSIIMYTNRRLFWGALMFVVYFAMSVDGYFQLGVFT